MAGGSAEPEYIGYRMPVFVAIFTFVEVVVVAVRFYARSLTARRFAADDGLVIASLLGQFVAGGIALGAYKQSGAGYHIEYIVENDPGAITYLFKYQIAVSAWYCVTISLPKLAICVLYRTLFPQRSVLIILWITGSIMVGTCVASLIADLAACKPFTANWASIETQNTVCINKENLYIWGTFPNIVTDVVLLAVPLPIIWRLHTSTQLKVGLSVTFICGSIGLVASILRFLTFYNTNSFNDGTYHAPELMIWTVAEPGIYLIAACLLTYRPLLEKFTGGRLAGKFKVGTSRSSKAKSSANGDHSASHRTAHNRTSEDKTGIRLASMTASSRSGDGFVKLSDTVKDQHYDARPGGITRTTDINMTWDAV